MFFIIALSAVVSGLPLGTVNARRTPVPPVMDGVLDEGEWDLAQSETCDFLQFSPAYGGAMSQPTTIRILYDDSRVYFGLTMYDSLPERMTEALTPRDNYINGEWIAILLDTWNDGRSAFSFEVSLANSQMDSRLNGDGNWDYGWDAVWESGTARLENGWSAEFAIPLSCLRFPDQDDHVWGVNFQRVLSRTSENGWYRLSTVRQMADIADFAELRGVSNITGSLGFEVRPYAAGRFYEASSVEGGDYSAEGGMDIKMGISSGITADFTLNPDFGQVEADEAEMNLGHFELFLREKRPFFLERGELFEMPFNLFYSRRIGAVAQNGDPVPIIAGAKVTGSAGSYRFGFLDAVTGRVWENDSTLVTPASNFGVFRGIRELGGYSYAAVSAVSKITPEQHGAPGADMTAAAFDGALEAPGNHLLHGSWAGTDNTGQGAGDSWSCGLQNVRSTLVYSLGYRRIGQDFNANATGYTSRTDYGAWEATLRKTFRPERVFSTFTLRSDLENMTQSSGELLGRSAKFEAGGSFRNGWNFTMNTTLHRSRFDPYEGPGGRYCDGYAEYFAGGGSNPFRSVSFWAGTGGGGYQSGGTFTNLTGNMRYRPVSVVEIAASGDWFRTMDTVKYNWQEEEYDTRSTDWRSVTLRMGYMFNTGMNIRLFSQYTDFSMDWEATGETGWEELRGNALFSWQYRPGSMLYILGETVFTQNDGEGFGRPDYGLYAKLTWFLPI